MALSQAVASRAEAERREFWDYRKGIVQAIDQGGPLWMLEIGGRWMPYIDETIDVGDLVLYDDDFADPFAWVREEEAGDYTGAIVTFRGGTWFTNGDGTEPWAGTSYDYDQSVTILGLDDIRIPPQNRVHPVFGDINWTGGIVFYHYRAAVASTGEADSIRTDISGAGLTPSRHVNWDGTIVPPLTNPQDEYFNLGGTLSLRTHDDIGLADLPGAHAHLVEPIDRNVANLQAGTFNVIREAESIVSKNIATEITTLQAGVDLVWPVPLDAPGKDWLMLFMVHMKPLIGAPIVAPLPKLDLLEPVDAVYSIGGVSPGGEDVAANTGGTLIAWWRSWRVGSYAPTITLDSGPDREVALSSFLVRSRVETA